MSIGRSLYEDEQHECPICEAEAPYVLYDDDKMCKHCGHVPGAPNDRAADEETEWEQWVEHRAEMYAGFTGPDRVKMVGGFASAYDFGSDFFAE